MPFNVNSPTFSRKLWKFKEVVEKVYPLVLEGGITVSVHWMGHFFNRAFFAGAVCKGSYGSPAILTSPCNLFIVSMLVSKLHQVISHDLVFWDHHSYCYRRSLQVKLPL